jgi:16S rRNA processing protein RimM
LNPDGHTRYAVGRIVKAFGIRGEMVVDPMTGNVQRFESLRTVFVGMTGEAATPYTVKEVRLGGSGVRVTLAEVVDRTAAEHLAGDFLFVDERERITPPAGTFFVDDVVGLRVITDEGRTLGTVQEVMHLPAQDVYVVWTGERDVLIPAVREFILAIDIAARTMRVHLIEGMKE